MNEKKIWDFLMEKTNNPYGTAAIMGNLMAESSLNPKCVNGVKDREKYISDADMGKIDFAHDGKAFGLVQWCYYTRKQGLLDLAKKKKKTIANLSVQLEYLWTELQKYKSVHKAVMNATAQELHSVSDFVMLRYEKPANTSQLAKDTRFKYAFVYLSKYMPDSPEEEETSKESEEMVVAKVNVNIRCGDGKNYKKKGVLKKGEERELVAKAGNWYAIRLPDMTIGWVCGDYIEIK